jgi:hypothetical protein
LCRVLWRGENGRGIDPPAFLCAPSPLLHLLRPLREMSESLADDPVARWDSSPSLTRFTLCLFWSSLTEKVCSRNFSLKCYCQEMVKCHSSLSLTLFGVHLLRKFAVGIPLSITSDCQEMVECNSSLFVFWSRPLTKKSCCRNFTVLMLLSKKYHNLIVSLMSTLFRARQEM